MSKILLSGTNTHYPYNWFAMVGNKEIKCPTTAFSLLGCRGGSLDAEA
jgi:hypothetical protein